MQSQKQAGGSDPFAQTQEDVRTKPLSIAAPDVHESMRLAGAKGLSLGPKEKNKRLLCCCGVSGCGIGPMTQIEESTDGGGQAR